MNVICFEKDITFTSCTKAAHWCRLKHGESVRSVINNPNRTAGGYHWCTDLSVFNGIILTAKNQTPLYCHETGEKFESTVHAEEHLKCEIPTYVIDNPAASAGGYHWSRSPNFFNGVELKSGHGSIVYCYQTKEKFTSITLAAKSVGLDRTAIGDALDNPDRSAAGKHWCTDLSIFDGVELLSHSIPVICYETKEIFENLTAAAKAKSISEIKSFVVDNPSRTAGGYHWCTSLDVFDGVELTIGVDVQVYCYQTKEKFDTMTLAAKWCGFSYPAPLSRVVDNPYMTSNGYHWCTSLDVFDGVDLVYPDSGISGKEKEVLDFVKSLTNNVEENTRKIIAPYELDIYIPEYNLAIEFNGNYWHSEAGGKDKAYHINKTNTCKDKGIQLLHIFEHQWLEKQEIFKSVIANKLGFSDKIYARKCKVVELKDCKEFLEINHLQGNCPSSIKLGLTYNSELVSVMTFGKPRFNKSYEYELIRFCNKLNTSVVGGASKLLKYFETKYKPRSIVSYANLQWSDGGLYNHLGFTQKEISTPNYWWIKSAETLTRYQCQKHKLKDLLGDKFNPKLSEKDNMENNGYSRLFDCGNTVFTKEYGCAADFLEENLFSKDVSLKRQVEEIYEDIKSKVSDAFDMEDSSEEEKK
jgi:hypothetical protein